MKKFFGLFIALGLILPIGLLASADERSKDGLGASEPRAHTVIITCDGANIELSQPVVLCLKCDKDRQVVLSPEHVYLLGSDLINGLLFELSREGKVKGIEPIELLERYYIEAAETVSQILNRVIASGSLENPAFEEAFDHYISAKNALAIIVFLNFLDSNLADNVMHFALDHKKLADPRNIQEKAMINQYANDVLNTYNNFVMSFWHECKKVTGRAYWVNSVAYSPDGGHIASGSCDQSVRIWHAKSGILEKKLAGHTNKVTSVAYSPDGKHIVSGNGDNFVRIWHAKSGILEKKLTGHTAKICSVAYSPDGEHIASGSCDQSVRIWDARSGALKKTLTGHTGAVNSVVYLPDGEYIASGGWDQSVRIWDARSGALKKTFAGNAGEINSIACSPDGEHIVLGCWDEFVCIWNVKSGTLKKTLTGHTNSVYSVAYSPDGNYIVSGGADNSICIWNAKSGILKKTLTGHTDYVRSVAYSPDGKSVVSGSCDKTMRIWGVEDELDSSNLTSLQQWSMLVANAQNPFVSRVAAIDFVRSVFACSASITDSLRYAGASSSKDV